MSDPLHATKSKQIQKGFTLIELMVVIGIVAILSAAAFATYKGTTNRANDVKRKEDTKSIASAYEQKYNSSTDLYQQITNSDFTQGGIPTPPGGGSYFYQLSSDSKSFRVCAVLDQPSPPTSCSSPSSTCYCIDSHINPYTGGTYSQASYTTYSQSSYTTYSQSSYYSQATYSTISAPTLVATGQSTGVSWTQNCSSNPNRMLIVVTAEWRADSNSAISNITYAGGGLTKLGQAFNSGSGPLVTIWYQLSPPAGTNNIQPTASTGAAYASSCWSGVLQTVPTWTSTTGNSANPSVNVASTLATDKIVDGLAIICASQANATAGTGQTNVVDVSNCNSHIVHSNKTGSAGSTGMSWSLTGSEFRWAQIAAVLHGG